MSVRSSGCMKEFLLVLLCVLTLDCLAQNAEKSNTEFDHGISGISAIDLTPEKIEKIALVGQVWGFLKYYHPTIAKGKYNWEPKGSDHLFLALTFLPTGCPAGGMNGDLAFPCFEYHAITA